MARIPKYRRHTLRNLGFVEYEGKRHYFLGAYGSKESRDAYASFLRSLDSGEHKIAKIRATVTDLVDDYLVWSKGYYPAKEHGHMQRVCQVLMDLHEDVLLADYTPSRLREVQNAMVAKGWFRKSINTNIVRVRQIFKWGAARELVPGTVYHALTAVAPLKMGRTDAPESMPVEPVDPAHVAAVLPYLTPTVADMVRVHQLTGVRSDTICCLRPVDVDRLGPIWIYRPHRHKTQHHGHDLIVPLGPKAQAILLPYMDRPEESYCFSPAESMEKLRSGQRRHAKTQQTSKPVKAPGACYTSQSYWRAIARAIDRVNAAEAKQAAQEGRSPVIVPHWHPHQLRHALATEVRRRFGLEAAQVALGHAHANITEVYAERDLALASRIAAELG